MLAETIVAEQDLLTAQVAEHRVGPVEHCCLDKGQRRLSEFQRVAGLDVHKVPVHVVVAANDGLALGGTVDGRVGNLTHQVNEGTAVVDLVVAHHDIVNLVEVDFLLEVLDKLTAVGEPRCVNQHIFLVTNQVGVVTRATVCGQFVAVERLQFPVHLTNPSHSLGQFLTHVFQFYLLVG